MVTEVIKGTLSINGRDIELSRAKLAHKCIECDLVIMPWDYYFITDDGDIHLGCLKSYLTPNNNHR